MYNMEYDKQNKKRFVIDYHNNEINNYLFDTNKFSLENKTEIIKDKNKQFCSKYALEKDYDGFIYSGNKNKCFLFNTNQFNKKIDQEMLDKYSIKRYKKTKYDNDFNDYESQNNSILYFNNENHYNFDFKNKMKEFNTTNIKKCLDECKNDATCKNALYMEQPKKCHFFKNKMLKNKNDINYEKKYDTYTIKKSINKKNIYHKNFTEISKPNNNNNNNNADFTNSKYSLCINTPQYKSVKEMNRLFDNICKKEHGNEYIFIQKDDDKNILPCNKDLIKIRCDYKLDNTIENYSNLKPSINSNTSIYQNLDKTNYYFYITSFLFVIFIIFSVILFVNFM